jgi:uncharacterized protein (TIGR03437 family)
VLKFRVLLVSALVAAAGLNASAQGLKLNIRPNGLRPRADSLAVTWTIGTPAPGPIGGVITSNIGSVSYQIAVAYTSPASPASPWISATGDSPQTPANLTIQILPAGLSPGTYVGTVTASTTVSQNGQILDASDTTTITLVVNPAPVALVPSVTPTTLTFSGNTGQSLAPKTLAFSATGGDATFLIASSQPWLSANPATGDSLTVPQITVVVNTAGLAANTYSGTLTLSIPGGTPSSLTVSVGLTLTTPAPVVTPFTPPTASLNFTAIQSGAPPAAQSFDPGGGTAGLAYAVTPSAAWISATPASGTTSSLVQVTVNPSTLSVGVHSGQVQVAMTNATPASYTLPVQLTITAPPIPVVSVSQANLSFGGTVGTTVVPTASVGVTATQGAAAANGVAFTTSSNSAWLSVSPASGTTPGSVLISVPNIATMAAGTLTGSVTVTGPDGPHVINVSLNLTAAPTITVNPVSITAATTAGLSSIGTPIPVTLSTASAAGLSFSASASSNLGLQFVGSTSGTVTSAAPQVLLVDFNATALSAGILTGSIVITSSAAPTVTIPVQLTVAPGAPPLQLDQTAVSLGAVAGSSSPATQTVNLTTNPGTLAFTLTKTQPWLTVTSASSSGGQPIAISASASLLGPGTFSDTVTIAGGGKTATVSVQFTVAAPAPVSFSVSPSPVSFSLDMNSATPGTTVASIMGLDPTKAATYAVYKWATSATTTDGAQWLSASLDTSVVPFALSISANPQKLLLGSTYNGTVVVTESGASSLSVSVPVSMIITTSVNNSYATAPTTISISTYADAGAQTPTVALAPQSAGIKYTAVASTTSGGPWLTIASGATGSMPASMGLAVDPSALPPGTYSGSVAIAGTSTTANLTAPNQSVPVSLIVRTRPVATIVAGSVPPVQFALQQGSSGATPASAVIAQLSNTGAGFLTATVTAAQTWLVLDQSSYAVTASGVNVIGRIDPASAPSAPGVYQSDFTISGPTGQVSKGTVVLSVQPGTLNFDISPAASTLTVSAGQSMAAVFTITNTGNIGLDFAVSTSGAPIGSPQSGHLNPGGAVQISVPATNIPAAGGVSFTNYDVVGTAGGASVDKTYQLVLQAPAQGGFDVSDAPAIQIATPPGTFDIPFTIDNASQGNALYTVGTTGVVGFSGLTASTNPGSGIVNGSASAVVHITGQIPNTVGIYAANVIFNVGGIAYTRTIALLSTGLPAAGAAVSPHAGCAASSLFVLPLNPATGKKLTTGLPAQMSVAVVDNCGNLLTSGSVTATFSSTDSAVSLRGGVTYGGWVGTWVPADASNSQVTITIAASDGTGQLNGSAKITAYLTGESAIPQISSGGVVLAGDYSRPLTSSPGQWISIFGNNLAGATVSASPLPFPTTLSGTSVLLNGKAIDLWYVSPGQINAFVPFGTPVNTTANLQVQRGSAMSVPLQLSIVTADPALFLAGPGPTNLGIVVDYRGSANFIVDAQHPVKPGDTLVLYALGLGPVNVDLSPDKVTPASPLVKVTSPVVVSIGGVSTTPGFAGMSAGSVGLYQVNVLVPSGVAASDQAPIIVTVGSVSSTAVTIPFQAQ